MAARVAVLTPFASPSVRGNAITVDRIDIDGDHVRATRTCDSCIAAG